MSTQIMDIEETKSEVRVKPELREVEPAPPAPAATRRRPRPVVVGVLALVALAAVAFGVWQWWYGRNHVTSDNAQVDGDIVPVLPKVSGYVAQVLVEENQRVREGDALVVLDDRDYRARLAQAEADLKVAEAAAGGRAASGQAVAQLEAARASVTEAEARDWQAGRDLDRYRQLADRDVIGRQELEGYEATARVATAHVKVTRDQADAAAAGLRSAQARVAAARAARDFAALQLSYTRITAPGSGIVSKKDVEVGQLVQAGQPLFAVVPLSEVWVEANLKETELGHVSAGDRVAIAVDTYPGKRFVGRVESVSPATGAKFSLLPPDNATGNFTKVVQRVPVRIRLEGTPDPLHPLRPGMSAKVVITT